MTIRMKKGDKYADVYDSPETIKQAQLDGYSIVDEKPAKTESVKVDEPAEDVKLPKGKKPKQD